jgi:hypothetical protein
VRLTQKMKNPMQQKQTEKTEKNFSVSSVASCSMSEKPQP